MGPVPLSLLLQYSKVRMYTNVLVLQPPASSTQHDCLKSRLPNHDAKLAAPTSFRSRFEVPPFASIAGTSSRLRIPSTTYSHPHLTLLHKTRLKECHAGSSACRRPVHSFKHRDMSTRPTDVPHPLSSDCQQNYRRLWWNMWA